MRKLLFISVLIFMFGYSGNVYARPKCGALEKDVVVDVFYAAESVERHFDITGKLQETCLFVKNIRKYEKNLPKSYMSRRYRKKRDELVETIENNMKGITSSLNVYRTWLHYKAVGSLEKSKRRIWLENSKRDATYYLRDIDDRVRDLRRLMMMDKTKKTGKVKDPVIEKDAKSVVKRVLDHVIDEHH